MKFLNSCVFITYVFMTLMQFGCLSVGVMNSAEKLVEAKDYYGAIEAYQNIIETKPGTSDARAAQLAIGEIYVKHIDQSEHGIKAYEALIAEAPTSDEAAESHYRLGIHAFYQENIETAQTQFSIIVNQFSHLELSKKAQLLLARCYEKMQKFEQAIEVYDNFVQQNPQSKRTPQILAYKARIQRKHLKNDEKAIRTLQLLVRKHIRIESAQPYVTEAIKELIEAKKELIEFNHSPFGFGPYPKVPVDYPYREEVQTWDDSTPRHELLVRVRIKLWEQGIQTEGAMFDSNGLIYVSIPGVLYVKWVYGVPGAPKYYGRQYAGRIFGNGETAKEWKSSYLTDRRFVRTDITPEEIDVSGTKVYVYPNGTKVYEYPDGGIDPYEFLGL